MAPNNPRHYDIGQEPIWVRPTLIVGLGGTGILALKWMNYLLRQVFDAVPPFIRLLAIDSDAPADDDGPDLPFPPADFINLFDHVHLADVIRDAECKPNLHPHLRDWLNSLDLPSAVVERGCQGLPRLGRVLFFEACFPVIYPAVHTRFEWLNGMKLKQDVSEMRQPGIFELSGSPVVHIVSSVCGGTGSGMLLDFAYMTRLWSERMFHRPAEVIGHLVLPEAFRVEIPQTTDKLRGVAASVLRQIEFLMDSRREHIPVLYPNGTTEVYRRDMAPFSSLYVLNGHGPQGGDHRDQLAEMIARTVYAMTVEPVGKEIQSDVNNKQLDILSTRDVHTKRPMCFSSYGLRLGVSADPARESRTPWTAIEWIGQRINSLADPKLVTDLLDIPESELPAALHQHRQVLRLLEATICRELNPEELVASTKAGTPATANYKIERVPPGTAKEAVRTLVQQGFRAALDAYRDFAESDYKKTAEEQVNLRLTRVRSAIEAVIKAHPSLEFAVAHIMKREYEQLAHRGQECAKANGEYSIVFQTEFQKRVNEKVAGLFKQQKPKVPMEVLLRREQLIRPVLEEAAKEAELALRKAVIARAMADALQKINREDVKAIHDRVLALPQVASEMARWREAPRRADVRCSKARREISQYGAPFLVVEPPQGKIDHRCWNEKDKSQKAELERLRGLAGRFESFVEETLAWISRDLRENPGSGERRRTRFLEDSVFLERLLTWERDYYQELLQSLRTPVDPKNPAEHPYFDKMREFILRGQPKVSANSRGRHSTSMRVIFAQHTKESCVKELLEIQEGRKMRSAKITNDYAAATDNWFQILQFNFGFCLAGIDTFDEYKRALKRYLAPLIMDEDDLWLSPEWRKLYGEYEKRIEKDRCKTETTMKQRRAADWDREIGQQFKVKVDSFFDGLLKCLTEFDFRVEKDAKECARFVSESRAKVQVLFTKFDEQVASGLYTFRDLRHDVEAEVFNNLRNTILVVRYSLFNAVASEWFDGFKKDSQECFDRYDLEGDKFVFTNPDDECDSKKKKA